MQIDLCDEDTFLQVVTVFITYECNVHGFFFDDDDDDDIEIRIGLGIGQGCFFFLLILLLRCNDIIPAPATT